MTHMLGMRKSRVRARGMLRRTIDHEREAHIDAPVIPTTYLDGQDEHGRPIRVLMTFRILGLWAAQKVAQHETDCPTPRARMAAQIHWDRNYRPFHHG